jgi:hypothetical protein
MRLIRIKLKVDFLGIQNIKNHDELMPAWQGGLETRRLSSCHAAIT